MAEWGWAFATVIPSALIAVAMLAMRFALQGIRKEVEGCRADVQKVEQLERDTALKLAEDSGRYKTTLGDHDRRIGYLERRISGQHPAATATPS